MGNIHEWLLVDIRADVSTILEACMHIYISIHIHMCWQCSATISMLECQVFSSKYGKPSQDDVFREIINYIAYAFYIYIYINMINHPPL